MYVNYCTIHIKNVMQNIHRHFITLMHCNGCTDARGLRLPTFWHWSHSRTFNTHNVSNISVTTPSTLKVTACHHCMLVFVKKHFSYIAIQLHLWQFKLISQTKSNTYPFLNVDWHAIPVEPGTQITCRFANAPMTYGMKLLKQSPCLFLGLDSSPFAKIELTTHI